MWRRFITVKPDNQVLGIFLSLEAKATAAIAGMDQEELNLADGVSKVFKELDKLYLQDKSQLAHAADDAFEKFKRLQEVDIAESVAEFERLHNKAKPYDMVLTNGILAYNFLNNASN